MVVAGEQLQIDKVSEKQLQEMMQNKLATAMESGAKVFMQDLQLPDSDLLTANQAQRFVNNYTFDLVVGITDTMVEQLRNAITEELDKGTTINQLQSKLAETVDNVALKRAEVIARTETARAAQYGAIEQARAVGFKNKKYLVSGNPCGLCEAADRLYQNKVVGIGEPFFTAGQQIEGTDGKTYTLKYDIFAASDMHPNCGCNTTFDFGV